MPRIEVEIGGKTYVGSYEIQGNTLEVSYGLKTKKTQLGRSVGPDEQYVAVARTMVRDLVREDQAGG